MKECERKWFAEAEARFVKAKALDNDTKWFAVLKASLTLGDWAHLVREF